MNSRKSRVRFSVIINQDLDYIQNLDSNTNVTNQGVLKEINKFKEEADRKSKIKKE